MLYSKHAGAMATEFFPKNLIKKSSKEDVLCLPEILSLYHLK